MDQESLLQYNPYWNHIHLNEHDFKKKTLRLMNAKSKSTDVESITFEDEENDENTIQNLIDILSTLMLASLKTVSFCGAPQARRFLLAMSQNPYNFPSLTKINVCNTDVSHYELDVFANYLCNCSWFIRDMIGSSSVYDCDAIFIRISNNRIELTENLYDKTWPPQTGISCSSVQIFKESVDVVLKQCCDNKLTKPAKIYNVPIIFCN